MNGMKIFGTFLAIALIVFVIAPVTSAQVNAGILHNQWFKAKVSLKGYEIGKFSKEVLEKVTGGGTVYLYATYAGGNYTIWTCTQDDSDPGIWYRVENGPIPIANIYGVTYPELWDIGDTPIIFFDGYSYYNARLTLYMKITADGPNLKKASMSTVSCGVFADLEDNHYLTSSCTLSGSSVPTTQVIKKVPAGCFP